jgi:hypothetical protein
MRAVSEFSPNFITGFVSASDEEGSLPVIEPEIEDVEDFESMVNESGFAEGPALPAASVTDAETVHVPSVKVGNEQLDAEPTV